MSAQREAFETWASRCGYETARAVLNSSYLASNTSVAWGAWQAAQAAMPAEVVALRGFARDMMRHWPDGNVDGGELQDVAEAYGLLKARTAHQPCRDQCVCAESVTAEQFAVGVQCYGRALFLLAPEERAIDDQIARTGSAA